MFMFTLYRSTTSCRALILSCTLALLLLTTKLDLCNATDDNDTVTESTTTPTAEPVMPPFPNMEQVPRTKTQFYAMCKDTGRCLGARRLRKTYRSSEVNSNKCIREGVANCHYVVAFGCVHKGTLAYFELYARRRNSTDSGYVAGGMSTDRKMGDDVVVACIWNGTEVTATLSYNSGRANRPIDQEETGSFLNVTSLNVTATHVHCTMNLNYGRLKTASNDEFLYERVLNILVAGGPIKGDQLLHHDARMSSHKVLFDFDTQNQDIALDPSYSAEQWHGMYMCFIWITWIPVGTFVSRFYKETWAQSHFVHRRMWHAIHTGCMIFGLGMALCAYLLVGYDRQQFIPPPGITEEYHAIIGLVAITLFTLQGTLSWFTPKLKARAPCCEKLLGKLHLIFGHVIYLLGVANIIMAPRWTYNIAPKSLSKKAITWLSLHAIAYIIMTVYIEWTDRHLDTGGYRAFVGCPMPIVSDEEAPRPRLRKAFLFLFLLASVTISSLMIESIQIEPVELRTDFGV